MKMQLSEIARALEIQDVPDAWNDIEVNNVHFDSRKLLPGSLFVPLKGERDGHTFIKNAVDAGAVATLWSKDQAELPDGIPALVVDDPLQALQTLAHYYLDKINPKVVAITGSNGKTTTKDMTAAILASQFNVVKTEANFNNEIGVPMTILGMNSNTEILVVELGMDRPGQLDFLSKIVQPDTAVITMIGEAHIEFFKTRDRIADAKMEITHGLKEDGVFIYNGDEPLLTERAKEVEADQFTFGMQSSNQLYASNIEGNDVETSFSINLDADKRFEIPMIGQYNVTNALAAIAVSQNYHIKLDDAVKALKHFDLTKNRTEWLDGRKGERILSDVYNSNPTAVKLVLASLAKTETKGRRIAVLGDMLELGEQAQSMHEGLKDSLDPNEIEEVFLVGQEMNNLYKALDGKYDESHLHYYPASELNNLSSDLENLITADDIVLLKASHGIHLETVVNELTKN